MMENSEFRLKLKSVSPKERFVCWIDVMGSRSIMSRSPKQAMSAVWTLQGFLDTLDKGKMLVIPLNDGAFIVSEDAETMRVALCRTITHLVNDLLSRKNQASSTAKFLHAVLFKGAVARGPIIVGSDIQSDVTEDIQNSAPGAVPRFVGNTLLGPAVTDAFLAEKKAPPMGIYIHGSARGFFLEDDLFCPFWRWWSKDKEMEGLVKPLCNELEAYYDWCSSHPMQSDYSLEDLKRHRTLAKECFEGFWQIDK